jgi:hypothetical protein
MQRQAAKIFDIRQKKMLVLLIAGLWVVKNRIWGKSVGLRTVVQALVSKI